MFNYRIAEASYGFVVCVRRPLPEDSMLETRFENPTGGPPFVVLRRVHQHIANDTFNAPPVRGVKAHRDYQVELRVLDRARHQVLATYKKTFRSDVSQQVLSDKPLVVDPVYHRNRGAPVPSANGLFAIIWAESKSFHNRLISVFFGCVHFATRMPGAESA